MWDWSIREQPISVVTLIDLKRTQFMTPALCDPKVHSLYVIRAKIWFEGNMKYYSGMKRQPDRKAAQALVRGGGNHVRPKYVCHIVNFRGGCLKA